MIHHAARRCEFTANNESWMKYSTDSTERDSTRVSMKSESVLSKTTRSFRKCSEKSRMTLKLIVRKSQRSAKAFARSENYGKSKSKYTWSPRGRQRRRICAGEIRENLRACRSHRSNSPPLTASWRSIDRSIGSESSRRGESCSRRVHASFHSGRAIPFPNPLVSIRMEIKRRINVSRADGPNVRTENPILACRVARLVRVSSLLHRHRTLVALLRFSPAPPSSSYFLIRSSCSASSPRIRARIRTSIEIGP